MARANANALKTLAAGKYMLMMTAATQRTGAQPDANTGEPSVYVNVRFETKERQYVYQNYSLNNPRALRNLLLAITGDEVHADTLLERIDWEEPADVEVLFNHPIIAEVTVDEYTDKAGVKQQTNRVGRVEFPKPLD
jgi:hypothetical protein